MGYLFLAIAIFSNASKGVAAKKVSDKTSGLKGAVFTNFIRMLFCLPVGFLFILVDGNLSSLAINTKVLCIAILAGVATSAFIVSWLLAVQKSTFTAIDTFVSMGLLVPILLSFAFYKEQISCSQILGLALLFIAVIVMTLYNNQVKTKLTLLTLVLLLMVGLANGVADFAQKIFIYNNTDGTPASVFNFYIYVFSAITLLSVFLCLSIKKPAVSPLNNEQQASTWDKRKTLYIAIMAIFLFSFTYFKTLAANRLPAVQVYPLVQGSAIILSGILGAVIFKEKIKPLCIVGLTILFAGLLLINVFQF